METDKLEVTKPIKLTTIDPKNFIRVTPSNEARLMRKAERIKKEREKTFIIYAAIVSPPIDEETGDYLFEEEVGLKVGHTGQTFERRWSKSGYDFNAFSIFTLPPGYTQTEVIKLEKSIIKNGRDAGHDPYKFKLNTMGSTETFHFDALLFIQKQFAIINKYKQIVIGNGGWTEGFDSPKAEAFKKIVSEKYGL